MFRRRSIANYFYCAFCKTQRRKLPAAHLGIFHIFSALFAAICGSALLQEYFQGQMIMLFVLFLGLTEVFLRVRWRLSLRCPSCGFDPMLYVRSPDKAASAVRTHFDMLAHREDVTLGEHPLLRLHRERVDRARLRARNRKYQGRPSLSKDSSSKAVIPVSVDSKIL